MVERNDRVTFPWFEPMVARNPAVVFKLFAVALLPLAERRRPNTGPTQQLGLSKFCFFRPFIDLIDDLIACFVGNPFLIQSSPLAFFAWMFSYISSAMTSFFAWIFSSSFSIFLAAADSCLRTLAALGWRSKQTAAFSKRVRCQLL